MREALSLLLLSGLLVGAFAAGTPFVLRLTGVGWLRIAAVPLSTVLFATSFTLAGSGPLLRPLLAGVTAAQSTLAIGAGDARREARAGVASTSAPFDLRAGFGPLVSREGPVAGIGYHGERTRQAGNAIVSVRTVDGQLRYLGPRARGGVRLLHRARGGF